MKVVFLTLLLLTCSLSVKLLVPGQVNFNGQFTLECA